MTEYRGFKYWLIETKPGGMRVYRIMFPGGHKTPPLERASEAAITEEIDGLIAAHGGAG